MIFNNILCFHEALYSCCHCHYISVQSPITYKDIFIKDAYIICFLEIVFVTNCAVYIFVFIVLNFY